MNFWLALTACPQTSRCLRLELPDWVKPAARASQHQALDFWPGHLAASFSHTEFSSIKTPEAPEKGTAEGARKKS